MKHICTECGKTFFTSDVEEEFLNEETCAECTNGEFLAEILCTEKHECVFCGKLFDIYYLTECPFGHYYCDYCSNNGKCPSCSE